MGAKRGAKAIKGALPCVIGTTVASGRFAATWQQAMQGGDRRCDSPL
jgi:hypothetical protein